MPASGTTSPLASLQAKKAATRRWHHDSTDIDREYAAARLAEFIKKTVDQAPPLTAEQRDRLALLLQGGPADAA